MAADGRALDKAASMTDLHPHIRAEENAFCITAKFIFAMTEMG
jgi:hypothetical protein